MSHAARLSLPGTGPVSEIVDQPVKPNSSASTSCCSWTISTTAPLPPLVAIAAAVPNFASAIWCSTPRSTDLGC